jgi:hypothetical protein
MSSVETVWYELYPYLSGAIGVLAISSANGLATAFGALLLAASALIIHWRISYRRTSRKHYAKARVKAGRVR